jgi:hypothetical protein
MSDEQFFLLTFLTEIVSQLIPVLFTNPGDIYFG